VSGLPALASGSFELLKPRAAVMQDVGQSPERDVLPAGALVEGAVDQGLERCDVETEVLDFGRKVIHRYVYAAGSLRKRSDRSASLVRGAACSFGDAPARAELLNHDVAASIVDDVLDLWVEVVGEHEEVRWVPAVPLIEGGNRSTWTTS
jgi:hypothetical protein